MTYKFSAKINKFIIIFCSTCLLISTVVTPVLVKASEEPAIFSDEILEYIEGIINWKKESLDLNTNDPLFNHTFLHNAGDTTGDWYPIGMGRIGYPDDYEKYLAVIYNVVEERYKEDNKLSNSKATEWHRISLAILSSGGDPTKIGQDSNGEVINLIADGTYDRGKSRSLGAQGLNGWIWGLITLDSMRYIVPKDAYDTRQSIIEQILKAQLPNGGFSLNSPEADADMTAMAIQALAPYYNSEEKYTYTSYEIMTRTVREVVDDAVEALSEIQLENGDFGSVGTPNAESTAQVIVALTSLGIDPLDDKRFVKNGNNIFQGIMNYFMDDGGFIHSKSYDPENPTSLPDESNTMASEQILYSLVALYRFYEGYRTLYDFREEMSEELKEQIDYITQSIDTIPENIDKNGEQLIEDIFEDYIRVPIEERSYVFNYYKLADVMEELGIKNTSEPLAEHMGSNKEGKGTIISMFDTGAMNDFDGVFTKNDVKAATAIPEDVTTEYYVEVVSLIDKLQKSTNKEDYDRLLEDLIDKKARIEIIKQEIDSLNQAIVDQLYPFDEIGIKDRKNVQKIIDRYKSLSPYDQQKIQSFEDVERAETKINNLIRARIITFVLVILIGVTVIFYVKYLKKRRRKKMEQKMLYDEK